MGIRFARGNDGSAYVLKSDPRTGNTDDRVQVSHQPSEPHRQPSPSVFRRLHNKSYETHSGAEHGHVQLSLMHNW